MLLKEDLAIQLKLMQLGLRLEPVDPCNPPLHPTHTNFVITGALTFETRHLADLATDMNMFGGATHNDQLNSTQLNAWLRLEEVVSANQPHTTTTYLHSTSISVCARAVSVERSRSHSTDTVLA